MKILHLSYDVPDCFNAKKTLAIKNLIDCNLNHENICVSLNRIVNKKDEDIIYNNDLISIKNFGLPKGILFRYTLKNSINKVMNLDIDFLNIELIHAHKLTFEGPIAYELYCKYNIPYIITLRHTDEVVLKNRLDMHNYYKKILTYSKKIIMISPWMRSVFKDILGDEYYNSISNKIVDIANIMNVDKRLQKSNINNKYITVFHIKNEEIKRKNIYSLLKAIKKLKNENINIELDIVGDGLAKEKLENKIKRMGLEENIRCLGARPNNEIVELMSEYKGFILCSYPETFGMVYIEALCSGIPLIYVKNTGIDGFFKDDIGVSVTHNSIKSISSAILELENNFEKYKMNVIKLQGSKLLNELFSEDSIRKKYELIIADAIHDTVI